ncbi:ribose ABC transporter permease [Christensenellaceae bacterium]|nr:ribose ABC transporter permease [Christensenellaceae bacterium]BDF60749.1 ribose ABC transporter permease [Christensenellaceae bacterium]
MNPQENTLKKKALGKGFQKYSKLVIAAVLIVVLFAVGEIVVKNTTGGTFASFEQVLLMLKFATYIALFGLAQMLVISAGGDIDLSVGYIATLVAVLSAKFMDGQNENLWIAILIAIGIGCLVGLANGLLTHFVKLPSLVVTMAMANILQGVVNVYAAGSSITGAPSPVLNEIAAKQTGIFPNILWILIIATAVIMILMYKTKIGVKLLGVGSNPTAAYLSGINVKRVRTIAFMFSGIIAGLVGLLLIGNLGQAFKDMASQYVMPSIAAVVVGGISLNGGEGNFIGVILGAAVLQTLTNLFVAFGWGDAGKWLGYGLILLFMLIAYVREKVSR